MCVSRFAFARAFATKSKQVHNLELEAPQWLSL